MRVDQRGGWDPMAARKEAVHKRLNMCRARTAQTLLKAAGAGMCELGSMICALLLAVQVATSPAPPVIRAAPIGHGIVLHYVDEGAGTPIVFVHGSISDGGYWSDQIPQFAKRYRAIAYSRRYN